MTKELLNNLYDAVDLAIHLQKEANENKIETEKKNHLRYLGQCLRVMKEQIDDGRKRTSTRLSWNYQCWRHRLPTSRLG